METLHKNTIVHLWPVSRWGFDFLQQNGHYWQVTDFVGDATHGVMAILQSCKGGPNESTTFRNVKLNDDAHFLIRLREYHGTQKQPPRQAQKQYRSAW